MNIRIVFKVYYCSDFVWKVKKFSWDICSETGHSDTLHSNLHHFAWSGVDLASSLHSLQSSDELKDSAAIFSLSSCTNIQCFDKHNTRTDRRKGIATVLTRRFIILTQKRTCAPDGNVRSWMYDWGYLWGFTRWPNEGPSISAPSYLVDQHLPPWVWTNPSILVSVIYHPPFVSASIDHRTMSCKGKSFLHAGPHLNVDSRL